MSKPGADPSSGISLGDVLRLPRRHPACRRREARSGSWMERENLAGDGKGKGASGANREAESTDAPERSGLLRSSDEAGVMLVERREQAITIRIGSTGNGHVRFFPDRNRTADIGLPVNMPQADIGTTQRENCSKAYCGNPAACRASDNAVARDDGIPNATDISVMVKVGCNVRTRAAASLASSSRPNIASAAADTAWVVLK